MRACPVILTLLLCGPAMAQGDAHLFQPFQGQADSTMPAVVAGALPQPGSVLITESPKIQGLMTDYAARKQPLAGYRVQIFLGERSQAENVRRTFLQQHPDIPAYLGYLAPNFRVRVGDLRDRVEAEHMRNVLATDFPGLYVVPDQIEPPRLPGPGGAP